MNPRSIESCRTGFADFLSDLELKAYVYPPISAVAEIDSFNIQSDVFNSVEAPKAETVLRILDRLEEFYAKSKWRIREDFLSDKHITDTIEEIMVKNHDKNPGAILTRQGYSTNKMVVDMLGVDGLKQMVRDRLDTLLSSEDTRYVADPVRIFQKPEPHKLAKAAIKRWRLIWGVSLIDQIVDRLLYSEVANASLNNAQHQAAKPGFNFKGGGVHRMVEKYKVYLAAWTSFDAKSFDFTVSGWQLDICRQLNERLCLTQGDLRGRWINLSLKREEAVKFGSFVFTDGTVCKQILPGIQKSGRLTTIDGNCKVTLADRVYYDIVNKKPSNPDGNIAMGDDLVANDLQSPEHYIEFVQQKCGHVLTLECEPGPFEKQNFCSATMGKTKAGIYYSVPSNYGKNSWSAANTTAKKLKTYTETIFNYCIEYAFQDRKSVV